MKVKRIHLVNGGYAIVSAIDYVYLNQWKWRWVYVGGNCWYAIRKETNIYGHRLTIYMHREVLERKLGRPIQEGIQTEHKNQYSLDNRRSNLREATREQNQANTGKRKGNNKYKGVYLHSSGKWQMRLRYGKYDYSRLFDTEEEAHIAHINMSNYLHGRFSVYRSNYLKGGG